MQRKKVSEGEGRGGEEERARTCNGEVAAELSRIVGVIDRLDKFFRFLVDDLKDGDVELAAEVLPVPVLLDEDPGDASGLCYEIK